MMDNKTTKMLRQAISSAMGGETVLVIGTDLKHCQQLMNATIYLDEYKVISFAKANPANHEISFWPKGQIRYKAATDRDWEAKLKRVKGYPNSVPIYIDHTVGEKT
jgi:hypothetical protein